MLPSSTGSTVSTASTKNSYREQLCNKDEQGVPLFSPMCGPGGKSSSSVTEYDSSEERARINFANEVNEMKKAREDYDKGRLCNVRPVDPRSPLVTQYTDTSDSSRDWFKDPTYSQLANMRERCSTNGVAEKDICEKFFEGTSDSFKRYRLAKLTERVAASSLRSL
jgi:hypothetical protein